MASTFSAPKDQGREGLRRRTGGRFRRCFFMVALIAAGLPLCGATDPAAWPAPAAGPAASAGSDSRYGLFQWLDHRSIYNQDAFPEPFLVDDSALEDNESRLDWRHTQAHPQRSDVIKAEIEKGFGLLTLELEIPFAVDTPAKPQPMRASFANVNLGARYPIYQYVSGHKFFDSTFGTAVEIGIPTHSAISRDTEVVPKIFNDLQVGGHFTLQSIVGYSKLMGSDSDGGLATFEYGFVFGYTIPHNQLPLPRVLQTIPVFELVGATELNKTSPGHNSLTGNAGIRTNLKAIGPVQPRLGLGYVFPIDNGSRADLHWGIITSLVFEY